MPSDKTVNSAESADDDTVIAEGMNPFHSHAFPYRTIATR